MLIKINVMRIKTILTLLLLATCKMWANDGDLFIEETVEGISIYYKIISEQEKTCQVGLGNGASALAQKGYPSGTITIPDIANGYNVIGVASTAFQNFKSEIIIIPHSVTYIGSEAFYQCYNLTSIDLLGVKTIGDYAFLDCSALESVSLSDSLDSIGKSSFASCKKLKEIILPNTVISIGNAAFHGCEMLSDVVLPNSLTTIKEYTFSGCAIKTINIPNSLESIGNFAFSGCI